MSEYRCDPETIVPDAGYFFGLGVFETIAVEEGRPLFLDRHLARLQKGLDFLGLEQTVEPAAVRTYLKSLPAIARSHGVLKITVSEKNVLFTHRQNPYGDADFVRGFSCCLSEVLRNPTSPFVYHKTLQYGENIQELHAAKRQGFDGAIFQNASHHFCEETRANLFFLKGDHLLTPRLENGLLNGTVRQLLLETLPTSERALSVEEADIPVADLATFDEAFLTNALMGVMPLHQLGNHVFKSRHRVDAIRAHYVAMAEAEPVLDSDFSVC